MYSLLQSLHDPANGDGSFHSLRSLLLNEKCLNDLDLYHLLLPFRLPVPSLQSLKLDTNYFTDVAAELLSVWILHHMAPSLQQITLGANVWHGKGLDKLLFALRSLNLNSIVLFDSVFHCVVGGLPADFRVWSPKYCILNETLYIDGGSTYT